MLTNKSDGNNCTSAERLFLLQMHSYSPLHDRMKSGSSRQGVGTVFASLNFAASHHYES